MTELRVTVPDEVAEQLAAEAAERGTTLEQLAADLLRQRAPATGRGRFPFIGIGEARPGSPSVAEMERMVEDGDDPGFPP